MPISISSDWIGGLVVTAGIVLVSVADPVNQPPSNCVDPDIVRRPDASVDARIAVFEPTERVDTTMVQSPESECDAQHRPIPPERN